MAEDGNNNHQLVGGNNDEVGDDIFVYTGGDQQVPRDVRRAKIDESAATETRPFNFYDATHFCQPT